MSRRLVAGNIGGAFRLRQVLPGYDAGGATPFEGVVFDSNFIPGRVIGSGTINCTAPQNGAIEATGTGYHGLGRRPDLILATARATGVELNTTTLALNATGVPESPKGWIQQTNGSYTGREINANLSTYRFSPFTYDEVNTNTSNGVTTVFNGSGGYRMSWDENYIYVTFRLRNFIDVYWTALEL